MDNVVRDTGWFKSIRSAAASESCVEVRITDNAVGVRDSKNEGGPAFSFAPKRWATFLALAKEGGFDQLS